MLDYKTVGVLAGLGLAILLSGCSSVHTEVKPGYEWSAVSSVYVEELQPDRWELRPLVRQELQGMGFVLLPSIAERPDLRVRFFVTEAVDLDAESRPLTKLKGVHVQMIDPDDSAMVAVSDYFLGSADTPEQGVSKAFAGLREKIRTVAGTPPQNAAAPGPAAVSMPTTDAEPQASGTAEPEPEIKSRQRSPWMPQLKSWGFEDWGRPRQPVQ